MTIAKGSAYPFDKAINSLQFRPQDILTISPNNMAPYGRAIDTPDTPPPIVQRPYVDPDSRSWRQADPLTGINKATIEGEFASRYNQQTHSVEATNLAVKSKGLENADYTIGWFDDRFSTQSTTYVRVVEYNNHKDAGQQFILKKGQGALFLLASAPIGTCPSGLKPQKVHADNICAITDTVLMYLPQGHAMEVGASVYHQPLYPVDTDNEVMALSIQGSIHNCTSCHFVKELALDMTLPLSLPQDIGTSFKSKLLHLLAKHKNYQLFVLRHGIGYLEKTPDDEAKIRAEILNHLNQEIEVLASFLTDSLSPAEKTSAEPLSLNEFNFHLKQIEAALQVKQSPLALKLVEIIHARIHWLMQKGRFLYADNLAFLYLVDSFNLSLILLLIGLNKNLFNTLDKSYQKILLHIRDGFTQMDIKLSPYAQIEKQFATLTIKQQEAELA